MGTELLLLASDVAETANGAADTSGGGTSQLILLVTVFVLAIFVGFEIITKIPPTLHTPLMSGSNAISGITVVGALIAAGAAGSGQGFWASPLGLFAVALATVTVVGGF
ncbi:MAG: proton-translocating transhydrogenase family protein, partial [Planctomycetota bacterium]